MIIILIILLIITYLIDNNNIKVPKYESIIKKPDIWIYLEKKKNNLQWKTFNDRYSQTVIYSLNKLCIKSIKANNSDLFNINIITDDNIGSYVPNFPWCNGRIHKSLKINYLKYYILYTKGGLWLPPDVLSIKNLRPIYDKINHYNMILIKNLSNIDERVIYTKPKLKVCGFILNTIQNMINKHYFSFENDIIAILNKSIDNSTYIFHNNFNGYFDYNNKVINSQHLLSQNITLFRNHQQVHFLHLNISNLEKETTNNWILKLTEKNVLQTNMWITKLFRLSFNLKQQYFLTDSYKDSYNLNSDVITISKKITSSYSPFLIVTKETSRNT